MIFTIISLSRCALFFGTWALAFLVGTLSAEDIKMTKLEIITQWEKVFRRKAKNDIKKLRKAEIQNIIDYTKEKRRLRRKNNGKT